MDNKICDENEIKKDTNEQDIKKLEQSIEQETLLEKQTCIDNSLTKTTHDDNTKETEEDYSCDGWIFDDNTGYWVEDTPRKEEPNIQYYHQKSSHHKSNLLLSL